MAPVIRLNATQGCKILVLVYILTRQLCFHVLRCQPYQFLQPLHRLAGHFLSAELITEFFSCPLCYRYLILKADIVAVVPQQPRFLVVFQRQQSPSPTCRRIFNGQNESD